MLTEKVLFTNWPVIHDAHVAVKKKICSRRTTQDTNLSKLQDSNMLRIPTDKRKGKMTERRNAVSASAMPHSSQEIRYQPFSKVSFYLDLKDCHNLTKLINDINILGGSVETFFSKDVNYVVTNRTNLIQHIRLSTLDDVSLPLTPNSLSNTKSGATNDSPSDIKSPKERNIPKTVTSRASAMLEQARKSATKGSSDVLQIAQMWGIKIIHLTIFVKKVKYHTGCISKQPSVLKDINKTKLKLSQKKYLKNPFLKFEDVNSDYKPQFKQFLEWPLLSLNSSSKRSPFTVMTSKKANPNVQHAQPSNENHNKFQPIRPVKHDAKFTQPIANSTSFEKQKTDVGIKPGFCESCSTRYEDIYVHIKGREHQKHTKEPGFYTLLDKKISELPNLSSFVKKVLHSMSNNSRSSDVCATSMGSRNLKENFSIPMSMPNLPKRKQHVDASQTFRKKLKPLTPNANNAKNCRLDHDCNANFLSLQASNQFSGSTESIGNFSQLKQSNVENILNSKRTSSGKRICDSEGTTPIKRKVLEPLDTNSISRTNFGMCLSQKFQTCNLEIQKKSSKKESYDEKPNNIRVLRSTSMRRISACQTSTKAASSPSLSNSLLVDLLDARKANSSPSVAGATKKKRSPLGVCRALDLGELLPTTTRRKSFLDARQKLKKLSGKFDSITDMRYLESELYPLTFKALNDMSFPECVQMLSPISTDPELGQRRMHAQQLKLGNYDLHRLMDNILTPENTLESSKEFTEYPNLSPATDSSRPLPSASLSDVVVIKVVPARDDVSKVIKTKKCLELGRLASNFEQATKISPVNDNEETVCAIEATEMPNFNQPLDLSSKRRAPKSPDSFQNQASQISPKNTDSAHNVTQPSQSSVFNLISSPSRQYRSTASSDVTAIPKSEGSIPKLVFKRMPGGKQKEWTLHMVLNDTRNS